MESCLDFISSNWVIILIILFQLFFKKKPEEQEESLDELFTLPEDLSPDATPSSHSAARDNSVSRAFRFGSSDQIVEQIHSVNQFIEVTLSTCQQDVDRLRGRVDVHSPVGRALPSISEREVYFLDQTKRCIDVHYELQRRIQVLSGQGLDNPNNLNQLLDEIEALMRSTQRLAEDIHALEAFVDSISAVHEEFVLAQSLRKHALSPLIAHRLAEGKDLATLPLALPPRMNHVANTLKQSGVHELDWFLFDYQHLYTPATWPLCIRESSSVLAGIAPGWREEWRRWREGGKRVSLPSVNRRSLKWRVVDSLNMWGDQLLGVHLMCLRFGPASLNAIFHDLEERYFAGDENLTLVGQDPKKRGQQTLIAPPAIEIFTAFATLELNGFSREVDRFKKRWRDYAGEELSVMIQGGKALPFPSKLIEQEVSSWVNAISVKPWKAWNQEPFSSVVGLICTRSVWSLAQTHASELVQGEQLSSLPDRIHWITVIHAAQAYPDHLATIRRFALHHHQEKLGSSRQRSASGISDGITQEDLVSAIALGNLFTVKRGLARV